MRASGFGYLVKQGARNLWANRLMSLASIGVLIACLLLVGASAMFTFNIDHMMGYVEQQNEVVVFLEEKASDATISGVQTNLESIENIATLRLVTRAEALENEREKYGADAFLLDDYTNETNPLLDSFVITLHDIEQMEDTLTQIRKIPHILTVAAHEELAAEMVGFRDTVTVGSIIIVAILMVVSIVVVSNTIKLTIYNRRKEIYIMKFVGATDTFIKLPYIIEGILLGVISAAVSYGVLWGGYTWLSGQITGGSDSLFGNMFETLLPFSSFALPLAAGFGIAGIGVGLFGGGFFINKHLKV